MRLVIGGVVPVAVGDGLVAAVPHLLLARPGIAVGHPARDLAGGLPGHQFHAVGAAPDRHEVVGEVRVHRQRRSRQVVQGPVGVLVIGLQGEVDAGVQFGPIGAGRGLPAPGGLDAVVAEFPGVHRRDGRGVGNQVDVLGKRVDAGLEREVLRRGILEREPEVGHPVERMSLLGVEAGKADAPFQRELVRRLPGVGNVERRLEREFPVQRARGDL